MKLRIGAAAISIERGDITDSEVDAIVNAANSTLAMGAGVAGAIKRKGGVIIEEEAMRQGPVEVGEAVLTTGGNLLATHVIHAAVMGPDLKTDADSRSRGQAPDQISGAPRSRYGRGPRAGAHRGGRHAEGGRCPPETGPK
jgi:Macro domain